MKVTIRDVAKHANVSISTVSRVMNNSDYVVEEKRARVLDAIAALQYQPNAFARGLIFKKSNTFGIMIPDIDNPYYSALIRGMQDAALELNHSLMICSTDRDRERLLVYIDNLHEKQVDGIIFASDSLPSQLYEQMSGYQIPFVLASTNSLDHQIPSVDINDELAGYEAVQHLIHYGHRRIGMIVFPFEDTISGWPRYRGFVRALRDHGLEAYSECIEYADHLFGHAYEATARLMNKHVDLTAIFAASDEFAMGVISYLRDHGIAVPDQMSVIGFDDIRMAPMYIPKLTTVAQPIYDIGFRAVLKLHELITTGEVIVLREKLPHQLIIRESTRRI